MLFICEYTFLKFKLAFQNDPSRKKLPQTPPEGEDGENGGLLTVIAMYDFTAKEDTDLTLKQVHAHPTCRPGLGLQYNLRLGSKSNFNNSDLNIWSHKSDATDFILSSFAMMIWCNVYIKFSIDFATRTMTSCPMSGLRCTISDERCAIVKKM